MIMDLTKDEIVRLLNGLNCLMTLQGIGIGKEKILEYEKSLKLAIFLATWVDLKEEYFNHNVRNEGYSFWFDNEGNYIKNNKGE